MRSENYGTRSTLPPATARLAFEALDCSNWDTDVAPEALDRSPLNTNIPTRALDCSRTDANVRPRALGCHEFDANVRPRALDCSHRDIHVDARALERSHLRHARRTQEHSNAAVMTLEFCAEQSNADAGYFVCVALGSTGVTGVTGVGSSPPASSAFARGPRVPTRAGV